MTFSELWRLLCYSRGYLSVTQMKVMKPIFTLVFTILFATTAAANTGEGEFQFNPKIEAYGQVTTLEMGHLLDSGTVIVTDVSEIDNLDEKNMARLYKFKNSRIKKALTFSTKRNKARMA